LLDELSVSLLTKQVKIMLLKCTIVLSVF